LGGKDGWEKRGTEFGAFTKGGLCCLPRRAEKRETCWEKKEEKKVGQERFCTTGGEKGRRTGKGLDQESPPGGRGDGRGGNQLNYEENSQTPDAAWGRGTFLRGW